MKYDIITTEKYLLVLGELFKQEQFPYIVAEKLTNGTFDLLQVDSENDWDSKNQYKILAHLPLNGSPILQGVDLLPPLEDEVEQLAESMLPKKGTPHRQWVKMGVIEGYNKAKEKYKYTEEDMINFAIWRSITVFSEPYTPLGEFRLWESLQQPKMPVGFECDMVKGLPIHNSNNVNVKALIPTKQNTKINSQGLTQWVGKYIYG